MCARCSPNIALKFTINQYLILTLLQEVYKNMSPGELPADWHVLPDDQQIAFLQ